MPWRIVIAAAWSAACVFVLIWTSIVLSDRTNQDAWATYVLFLATLVVLTFPSGIVVLALVAIPGKALADGWLWWAWLVFQWVCFTSVGYYQWFVFVPRLFVFVPRLFARARRVRAVN
jgi:hypothetical protein